jgi:acetyl-CoA acetyltransferase
MSRATVREAVRSWIDSAQITTLNQTLSSFPKRLNFQVNSFPGQNSRAAAVVFIENETESRIAIGGVESMSSGGSGLGWKRVDYGIALQIFHHSLERNAEDAMSAFDDLIDAVKTS